MVGVSLLQTSLVNVTDPIPKSEQGSSAKIALRVELFPEGAGADPLQAKRICFSGATSTLELTALPQTLRKIGVLPDFSADHAAAIAMGQTGQHERAAVAYLRLAARGDAPVIAIYGLATQLFLAGQARQARQVAQFLAAIWTDDPRPQAVLGTIQGATGAMSEARNSLARAAHLSRRDPAFRGVLRYCQRELLKLQFHHQPEPREPIL